VEITVVTGMSGSGKSVALKIIEDLGFYCIDNLPLTLLEPCIETLENRGYSRVAIGVDIRNASTLTQIKDHLNEFVLKYKEIKIIFLDATDEDLVRRFSETRRPHPLAAHSGTVIDCICKERELFATIEAIATHIDTSGLSPTQLRSHIKDTIKISNLDFTLILQSFGFKNGVPLDADFIFDARCLPNPYYEEDLRSFNGLSPEIKQYFSDFIAVYEFIKDISVFTGTWSSRFKEDGRKLVSICIGCTGGKHRSVYVVDQLVKTLQSEYDIVTRHRDLH